MIDIDELKDINEELIYLGDSPEQYQAAIVGVTYDNNHVIYDVDKFAACLVEEGMTYEEAYDWIGYNTHRSIDYLNSPYSPILMYSRES